MNATTTILAWISSTATIVAAAVWLSKKLVGQLLQRDIEKWKIGLQAQFDHQKAELEGNIRERVETLLADRAANRDYSLEARKRLYLAIGPIRFQLLVACRDLALRITDFDPSNAWDLTVFNYYGQSMLFRVLRPLALVELAEREIAYADFAIEPDAINLLRFKKQAHLALSGRAVIRGHPMADWEEQRQHLFWHSVSKAASALIVKEDHSHGRCMRFDEFEEFVQSENGAARISPLPDIFSKFAPKDKPLFWLRLVALGYLCSDYINRNGVSIGFAKTDFPVEILLLKSEEEKITSDLKRYAAACRNLPNVAL